jgi:hypothetical protein
VLRLPDAGEGQPLAGVEGDHAVAEGAAKDGPHVVGPGADGAGLEAGVGHDPDPLLEVGAAQLVQRDLAEGDRPS